MRYSFFFLLLLIFSSNCLTIDNNQQCSIRDSCSNLSLTSPLIYNDEIYIQSRNCFCDSLCQEYGDCCNQLQTLNSNYYQCIDFLAPTITNNTLPFNRLSVWMRTKCLLNYIGSSSDILCRNLNKQTFIDNPLLFIPVTSIQTNITYRNYFCAYCNNDANIDIQFWEYRPFCHGNGSIFDYMILNSEEQVNYYIHNLTRNCLKTIFYPHRRGISQPSVFIRPCKNFLPPICPSETPIDLARNCSLSNPAYRYDIISNVIYHNPYCAECNNIHSHEITCLDPFLRSSIATMNLIRTYPLSILFDPNLVKRYLNYDLENNSSIEIIYSLAYNCSKSNELYNLFLKKCTQITNRNKEIILSMNCLYPIQTYENYIQYNNGSLYLINRSLLLTKDQYVLINNYQIIFCIDQWKQIIIQPYFSFYRNILSIICTSISLFCLLIFVISFWLISSLHNLPGKCLLFLTISLFIGQLTFISTSNRIQYSSFCFISAIIIHYFYLSSFFWLLIIAIHIHSTFNFKIVIQRDKIKTNQFRLVIYNILVWCSTGIIIFIACLIQFIKPQSSFSPNYGFLFCSISQSNAMIVFFLIPIGCLLIIIASLFFKTILAIYNSHRIAKLASLSSSNNNDDNSLVFIYIRLASLMGLQWILLISALCIQQTWSWIIFEIINSLPGVFICFGFLFSQRLWNSIKQRITLKLLNRKQSSKSNITSTSLMSPTRLQ
jgi:hypothetical protein